MKSIKYIELFSGIGAFSQAIKNIKTVKAECVFAADIDPKCSEVYKENYGIDSLCDITIKDEKEIPKHDLCFFSPPCQAFSKSGKQLGFDESRGTLIFHVFRILKYHKPKYILMENVRNIVSHDNGNTWKVISQSLRELGYRIPKEPIILSPHQFKNPQTRDRTFLPGVFDPENVDKPLEVSFDKFSTKDECKAEEIMIANNNDDNLKISNYEKSVLDAWDAFYQIVKSDTPVIGYPIWSQYFGQDIVENDLPNWKKDFINKNINLYKKHKEEIDARLKKYNVRSFKNTHQKFEWQAGKKISNIWEGIIQFRPSGIRVKAPTTFPALVAIVQIPIYGPYRRRLSVEECAKLQNFPSDFKFGDNTHTSYKQLGNSINVTVLEKVTKELLKY